MPRTSFVRSGCLFAVVAVGSWTVSVASAEQPATKNSGLAGIYSYSAPDDTNFFALSLKAKPADIGTRLNRDHVVLVDTSASQFGEHRTQAFAVLKSFLASLPAEDRICLFAVDVASKRLTAGFVAPKGDAIDAGLAALHRRFPAGATNLPDAVLTGLRQLDAKRPGSIVYIGDGMSTANLLQSADLKQLLGQLRDRQVPVHSYAVGPRADLQLLGIIGQQTGGMVLFDAHDATRDDPVVAGRRLAIAADLPVFYPDSITLQADGVQLLPATALPLRSDRETIYLGQGILPAQLPVTISDDEKTMRWNVLVSQKGQSGNTFLGDLWKRAAADRGLSVHLAGMSLFRAAQDDFENSIDRLTRLGEQAVAVNNFAQAEEIGLAIREQDPSNVRAAALIGAARKKASVFTVAQAKQPAPQPGQPPKPANEPDLEKRVGATDPAEQDLIDILKARQAVREEALRLEVQITIQFARKVSAGDPDAAIGELKRAAERVNTSDIDPYAKQQMIKTLRSVRLDVIAQKEIAENARIQLQNKRAEGEAQRRLVEALEREEEKIAELIDQVRALLEEARHGADDAYEEAEAVAAAIVDIRPGNGPAAAALFTSEAAGQLNKAFRLRALRADRFLETLYQVELSHVPFPDEPPIRWPAAEVWKALTERRRKWASVDLHKNSPAEERIQAALDETTSIEFFDTSLIDAIQFISDLHEITIILNETALGEEGITSDEPISQVLAGISLRSTLKIILEPLGLTYVIEDEVMKVTTEIDAEERTSTRVYPVADLVIPIVTPQAGGLGQGQGGAGGIGGGGGGQFGGGGGGQFGGGGGGTGGGLFSVPPPGMGNGFFSVPAARFPAAKKAAPVRKRGKQIKDAEVQRLLDGILQGKAVSRVNQNLGQSFAQVKDPLPKQPVRFDNKTIESIKAKKKRNRDQ